MSTLMTERRRPLENDDGQVSLFGGDDNPPVRPVPPWQRPAPAARPDRPPVSGIESPLDTPCPEAVAAADASAATQFAAADTPVTASFGATAGARVADLSEANAGAPAAGRFEAPANAPARTSFEALLAGPVADELVGHETLVGADEDAPGASRATLAGPTLDDVMSRVWEGLVTGLPAACPLCHGEVVPTLQGPLYGRCSSCGTTID